MATYESVKEMMREQGAKPTKLHEHVLRFCAWLDAKACLESNSERDWVDLFQRGHTGYKTEKDCDEFLSFLEDDCDEYLRERIVQFLD